MDFQGTVGILHRSLVPRVGGGGEVLRPQLTIALMTSTSWSEFEKDVQFILLKSHYF